MKKVFIIHGFEGEPNGGWRPWLMGELHKHEVYACALAMPDSADPVCEEWVEEIARHVERTNRQGGPDEIYLVGHSLGVPAILRYLESKDAGNIAGAVLISGPFSGVDEDKVDRFLNKPFDYVTIKKHAKKFLIIHGDNDGTVPPGDADLYAKELSSKISWVKDGGHLSGGEGWFKLPQALDGLLSMMDISK